jgi:ABC-2 type transport system permease protein
MQTTWLVAHREFTERLRSRAYQLSTLITLLLVAGLLVVPTFFDDPTRYEIGLAGSVPDGLEDQVLAAAAEPDTEVVLRPMGDAAAIRVGLEEGDIDIGLVDKSTVVTGPDSPPELVTVVTAVAAAESLQAAAEQLDIDPGALGELLSAAPVVEEIEPVDDAEEQRLFLAFIGTLVLFVSIVTYGQWVLQGVVEEKSSRVVEVILGAVQPRHLLGGKVLGIGALGLIQVLLIAGTGFVASRLTRPVDLPPITLSVVMTILVWFVLGFAFYAAGYAVAGSLVSNNEDAQNASFPLTLVLLAGYFVATSALGSGGDNVLVQILSIVPPFSPMVMPLRQVSGEAAAWEVALAMILMVAAIVAMLRFGGRVYSGGLLRSGGRAKLRDAFRSAEA